MPAIYPMMVDAESFKPGECVRKFVTESAVTPFCGIVTHIAFAANKVWVQWPIEHSSESPETLIKVNPMIFGLPTVTKDHGYSSYEKELSEKLYGRIPKAASDQDKMAIRIAHTFATEVVGKLVDSIVDCQKNSLTDVQAYNRVFDKFGDVCSDYIIKSSIKKVYAQKQERKRCRNCGTDLDMGKCPKCDTASEKNAADLRRKAIKLLIDIQDFYRKLPDMREPIAKIEKVLSKAFNITERELIEEGFPKDIGLFTRS